jgi:hypothetical protein
MTEKTQYWLRNPADGTFAVADGAEERDRLIPLGSELADEPTDPDFVWMRHDDIADPARIPFGAREHFLARGWTFGAPPAPVDLTKDPQLVDPPLASSGVVTEPVMKSPATAKPATAADKKES